MDVIDFDLPKSSQISTGSNHEPAGRQSVSERETEDVVKSLPRTWEGSQETKEEKRFENNPDNTSKDGNGFPKERAPVRVEVLEPSSSDFVVRVKEEKKEEQEVEESRETQVNESFGKCFNESSSENGAESFPRDEAAVSEKDSVELDRSSPNFTSQSKNREEHHSRQTIQDLIDKRFAEARLDVFENKLDRVLMKIEHINNDQQRQLFQVLLARIKDLEDKLDKKTTAKKGNRLPGLPLQQYSDYVVEKATQTPSEEHDCEGVYVLVSKKNKQQVRQVHRQVAYVSQEESNDGSKNKEPGQSMNPQPLKAAKKVIKRVGYPEYVYEESMQGYNPAWNKVERKTIAFLPPIPRPYSRRRPRYTYN